MACSWHLQNVATKDGMMGCSRRSPDESIELVHSPSRLQVDLPDVARKIFRGRCRFSTHPVGQIRSKTPANLCRQRGVGRRHERWDRLRWTRQRRARDGFAGRVSRERAARADERRLNALCENFGRQHMSPVEALRIGKPRTAKACGPGARGWRQADGDRRAQPGFERSPIRQRRRQDEFVSGESAP
jgi:hypothetical protein